jgi:hypothetical protein
MTYANGAFRSGTASHGRSVPLQCLAVCRRVAGRQAEAYRVREEARARGFGDGAWMAHVRDGSFATVLKHHGRMG